MKENCFIGMFISLGGETNKCYGGRWKICIGGVFWSLKESETELNLFRDGVNIMFDSAEACDGGLWLTSGGILVAHIDLEG